jgi:hypothetical protein
MTRVSNWTEATRSLSDDIIRAAAKDAGNRAMRRAGRTQWSIDDYNRSVQEHARLLDYCASCGRDNQECVCHAIEVR